MKRRVISFLRHDMSSRQALSMAIDMWAEDRTLAIVVVAEAGKIDATIRAMRVAFAREAGRSKQEIHYGFTVGDQFPFSDAGLKGEAIAIYWRITPRQLFKNLGLAKRFKEHLNVG